jgi:glycosyltransferase involved in cell wall biosynthesis
MAERARRQFPRRAADIHACLNGVDEAFFRITRPPSDGSTLRVLAVGNLIRLKGFDVLIEAVARARCRECVRVCVVGDGAEGPALSALASARGVSACFEFAGRLPVTEMPARFAGADVFVLSSRSEGRPNVVVEALASGLPVISTDLDGVRGMVKDGENGWLVSIDDVDQLADALDQANADRAELHRRGECARAMAGNGIGTWTETAQAYDALFRTVLTPSEGRRPSCAG